MKNFPKEENGSIEIIDNLLRYNEGRGNESEELDLNTLNYVNVKILGDTPFLLFFSQYQHYVSSTLKGFEQVYRKLSARFGFDDEAFFEVINQQKEITKRLWIKPQKTNYHFLEQSFDDYQLGWEVQSNPTKFISWDTTMNELKTLEIASMYLDEFGNAYYRIDYPVRLGNMLIDELTICSEGKREDLAVQEFVTDLYHESLSDQSYQEIKEHWNKIIPTDVKENGYERKDQNYLTFYLTEEADIYFSLLYNYNFDSCNDDGSTSFHIVNNRDYSDVMYDEALEESVEISDYVVLNDDYDLNERYTDNVYMVYTPERVKAQMKDRALIWLDEKVNRIGFSNTESSLVYPISDIDHFTIYNVLAARGPGYAQLRVRLHNGAEHDVFTADTYEFDYLASRLKKWTKRKVEIPGPYYND